MQSVPITTNIVSLNPTHGEVYSIQHYVIKFVSDLREVSCFLRVLLAPIKLTATILLKVALNTLTLTPIYNGNIYLETKGHYEKCSPHDEH